MKSDWLELSIYDIKADVPGAIAMGPFGSNIKAENYKESGVPVIRGFNLGVERFYDDEFVYLSEQKADELQNSNAFPEDLVFTAQGTIGQVGIVPKKSKFPRYVLSQNLMKVTCDKAKVEPLFLFYYFRSNRGHQEIMAYANPTGVPSISQPLTSLKSFKFPCPPLTEQRAIAGILGALDDKIELNRRMNRTLESMARAVFRQWFVENEEAEDWKEKILEDVTVRITKGTTPTTLGQRFTNSGINFVKVNSITDDHKFIPESFDFIDEATNALLSRSIIEKDDVLLTIAGTIGRIAKVPDYILPANTNQAVAIIRPDKSQVLPNYIRMWLCLDEVRQELFANVVHAVQANLSLGMISKTKIRLPEYSQLVKLFEPIESLLQKIDANTKESRTLASLRDSLLPKLMRGEVRVKE